MKNLQITPPPRRSSGARSSSWRSTAAVSLPLLGLALLAACATVPMSSRDPRARDLRNQPPPRSLPVPVDRVSKSALRNSYGDPRNGGRRHEGIDIFAGRNTPVLSTTEGYVSRVGRNGLGGNVVWVEGPAGWRHYYAHLERWGDVREGQWVEPGTIIGYVGNSGNAASTATHLHYGIYLPSGGTTNPYPLLARGPGPILARHPAPGGAPVPTGGGRDAPTGSDDEVGRRARGIAIRVLGEILAGSGGRN